VDDGDTGSLLSEFFRLLPRFTNIQRLECRHIPFSDLALTQLCQLGRLRTLELDSCIIIAGIPPPKLKVTNLHFRTSSLLLSDAENRGRLGWLDVLHPDHTRRVQIDVYNPRDPNSPSPPLVNHSQVDLDCICRNLATIVSHSTALEELVIAGWYESDGLAEHSLPLLSLRVYDGPSRLFEVLHTGKDLRTLTLHGDPWTALCQLKPQSSLIECMELHVDTFSSTDVAVIKRMFAVGIRINHLGMHAIFSDSDTVSSFTVFAISTCLMFTLQMFELNKACMVPGPGMKTLSYSYCYSSSR